MTTPLEISRAVGSMRAARHDILASFTRELVTSCVTCTKGCNHCCKWPSAISVLEGAEIYLHLKKTRRWTKSFQENLVKAADAVTGLAYQIWLYSETACPFLDVKGLCSVYAVRPLTCRTAASRGNPDECHPQELVQAHKIVQRVSELNEFSLAERAILRLFNADYHTMPIPTAVLVAQRICDGEYLLGQAGSAVLAEHIGRF